ncbi:hypothetical protein SNEBB_003859 [Seison nebaliae]|nr:hypothetical protein SNEBB_003859 [Seison nebaliae]
MTTITLNYVQCYPSESIQAFPVSSVTCPRNQIIKKIDHILEESKIFGVCDGFFVFFYGAHVNFIRHDDSISFGKKILINLGKNDPLTEYLIKLFLHKYVLVKPYCTLERGKWTFNESIYFVRETPAPRHLSHLGTLRNLNGNTMNSACEGMFRHVVTQPDQYYINYDRCCRAVFSMNSIVRMLDDLQPENYYEMLKNFIGLKIRKILNGIPRRTYRVKDVTMVTSESLRFRKNQTVVSVHEYYQKRYGITTNGSYPCFRVGCMENPTFLPIEVCQVIPGQLSRIRTTNLHPPQPSRIVSNTQSQIVNNPIFVVDQSPLKVQKCLTENSTIRTRNNTLSVLHGEWTMSLDEFYRSAEIKTWFIVLIQHRATTECLHKIEKFIMFIIDHAKRLGMTLSPFPQVIEYESLESFKEIFPAILEQNKERRILFLFIIAQQNNSKIYKGIKTICFPYKNIVNQCIRIDNINSDNSQKILSLLMKINTKFGGIPHVVPRINRNRFRVYSLLFMGIYITKDHHFGTLPQQTLSIVLTTDINYSAYKSVVVKFPISTHLSFKDKMRRVFTKLLKDLEDSGYLTGLFIFQNKILEKSETNIEKGQFALIKSVCNSLRIGNKCTYIICDRLHKTKIISTSVPRSHFRVCINKTITKENEFFLYSHNERNAKPSHYIVLENEMNYSNELLEELCLDLSHCYMRCSRSISLPVPLAYAKLLAERTKILDDKNVAIHSKPEFESCVPDVKEDIKVEETMYFI